MSITWENYGEGTLETVTCYTNIIFKIVHCYLKIYVILLNYIFISISIFKEMCIKVLVDRGSL